MDMTRSQRMYWRYICLLALLGGLGVGVCFLRLWTVSPAGMTPMVKVSIVNVLNAWWLAREARQAAAQGEDAEAARLWQVAVATHRAHPGLLRGALEHYAGCDSDAALPAGGAAAQAAWLLRLSGGQRADVGLAARVYARVDDWAKVLELLEPRQAELTVVEERLYLTALFRLARMEEFAARCPRAPASLWEGRELALYRAAYWVGWGPPSTMAEGRRILGAALQDRETRVLANALKLQVSIQLLDVAGAEAAMRQLEKAKRATTVQRVGYWLLLKAAGQVEAARALALQHDQRPVDAVELRRLVEALMALGCPERALDLLRKHVVRLGDPGTVGGARLWLLSAEVLAASRRWDEMRAMALELRVLDQGRRALADLSYYMEGRADYGLDRGASAAANFAKASEQSRVHPFMALYLGRRLLELGWPEIALRILASDGGALQDDIEFWQLMFQACWAAKQAEGSLIEAARKLHEAWPEDLRLQSNYAAALMVNRQAPAEAILLTRRFLDHDPGRLEARINHALALAMGGRGAEAAALLATVDAERLEEPARSYYQLARCEIHVGEDRLDLARADRRKIQPQHLFPSQVRWLDACCPEPSPALTSRAP